jgi:hypothetical protein
VMSKARFDREVVDLTMHWDWTDLHERKRAEKEQGQ